VVRLRTRRSASISLTAEPVRSTMRHAVERDPVAAAPGQALDRESCQPTSAGSSRPCNRSRPRWTAAMNFDRLTSSVFRITSA
jgi:hypothetical protein